MPATNGLQADGGDSASNIRAKSIKRFARLTAGHSKKIGNHVHMVGLYTCWYNFAWIKSAVRMSPATEAHLTGQLWDIGDIVKLIEAWEPALAGAALVLEAVGRKPR